MDPTAEVSFILADQRRRAWFYVAHDQDLRPLEAALIEAGDAVRRAHGADALMDVGVNHWHAPDVAKVGSARDVMDFLCETTHPAMTADLLALCRMADAVDREYAGWATDANHAHAMDAIANACVMVTFNWRAADAADYGEINFLKAVPHSPTTGAFMGQLSNWLMSTGVGYDLSYGPLPPDPIHRSIADACSTLGEQLAEMSDPKVDAVASAWGEALQRLGESWRAGPARKVRPRAG